MRIPWQALWSAALITSVCGLMVMHLRLYVADPPPSVMVKRPLTSARAAPQYADQCVVMFDNRATQPPANGTDLAQVPYLSLSVATNALYARRQGYRFLFYNFSGGGCRHPTAENQTHDLPMTWCKLVALEDALFRGQQGPPCRLVLLLDSDAVVVDLEVRLEDFVAEHGRGRAVLLAHLDNKTMSLDDETLWQVHGVQRHHPWMFFSKPGGGNYVNAGVMLFQRGDGARLKEMLEVWWSSALLTPPELEPGKPRPCWGNCLKNWPHEQAIFEIFVWPRFREDVALLPLDLLNGFSGRFVRHAWGLVKARRAEVLSQALAVAAAAATLPEVSAGAMAMGTRARLQQAGSAQGLVN